MRGVHGTWLSRPIIRWAKLTGSGVFYNNIHPVNIIFVYYNLNVMFILCPGK